MFDEIDEMYDSWRNSLLNYLEGLTEIKKETVSWRDNLMGGSDEKAQVRRVSKELDEVVGHLKCALKYIPK